jgi:hypothetical protein
MSSICNIAKHALYHGIAIHVYVLEYCNIVVHGSQQGPVLFFFILRCVGQADEVFLVV